MRLLLVDSRRCVKCRDDKFCSGSGVRFNVDTAGLSEDQTRRIINELDSHLSYFFGDHHHL